MAFQLSIILTGLEVDRNGPPSVIYPKMEDLTCGWRPRSIHLPWNHYMETNKIVNKGAIVFYVCYISLACILTNTVNFNQPSVQSCISLYVKHMYYVSLSLMMEMLTARNVWGLEYLWQPHLPNAVGGMALVVLTMIAGHNSGMQSGSYCLFFQLCSRHRPCAILCALQINLYFGGSGWRCVRRSDLPRCHFLIGIRKSSYS